jgi:hypothetical protein
LDELWSARIDDVDASFWRDFFNIEYRVFRKFLARLFEFFLCFERLSEFGPEPSLLGIVRVKYSFHPYV